MLQENSTICSEAYSRHFSHDTEEQTASRRQTPDLDNALTQGQRQHTHTNKPSAIKPTNPGGVQTMGERSVKIKQLIHQENDFTVTII